MQRKQDRKEEMKHYSYYSGGILQEETNSKNIARMLFKGELERCEKILDMQTGVWVPIEKQTDIMRIYSHMRQVSQRTSLLGEYFRDTCTVEDDEYLDICPDRVILGFIPLWSSRQIFWKEFFLWDILVRWIRAYKRWRDQD